MAVGLHRSVTAVGWKGRRWVFIHKQTSAYKSCVPFDMVSTQWSLLPSHWGWDICWSSLHLIKCVHSEHRATSSSHSDKKMESRTY